MDVTKGADSMKVKSFFNIGGTFKLKWIIRKGFWRLLKFAFLAKLNIVTSSAFDFEGCRVSIGSSKPIKEFVDKGYRVYHAGQVLGEILWYYEYPFNLN